MITPAKHSILSGMTERIKQAELLQGHFNDISVPRRQAIFFRHNDKITKVMSKFGLDCHCRDCFAVLDRFYPENEACSECGSFDIASPYYC